MSTPSPKRQRLTGYFSPASPLDYTNAAQRTGISGVDSPANSLPFDATLVDAPYGNFDASLQPTEFTPPSSVTLSSSLSQSAQKTTIPLSPLPAKAHAAVGVTLVKDSDGDSQMEDAPSHAEPTAPETVTSTNIEGLMRSDHDRIDSKPSRTGKLVSEGILGGNSGLLFKLCEHPHPISRPHPTQNLISLYNLENVARSVARKDPVTGEKINKLRKSYEGKVKALQIPGKNKAVSVPQEFTDMVQFPDEEWYNQKVFGKEIQKELSPTLLAKLERVVRMCQGSLPAAEAEKWKNVIGTDETPKPRLPVETAVKKSVATVNKPLQVQGRISAMPSPVTKASRPDRAGKKRSYHDSSFKGYGEGFADDDPMGDSSGEEDRGGAAKKKRRKDYHGSNPLSLKDRGANFGVGLVGVGNGVYR